MKSTSPLTPSLEDYLETIYLLHQGSRQVRVRDIAKERQVRAASVTPALKRLADLGYLEYKQREFIELTENGKQAARRVYARHVLLFQFFHDILGMQRDKAQQEACGLEHALSDEGMDRFVRLFETITASGAYAAASVDASGREQLAKEVGTYSHEQAIKEAGAPLSADAQTLWTTPSEEEVVVRKVRAKGELRKKIIDTGLLPKTRVRKLSHDASTEQIWILIQDNRIELTRVEADAVVVNAVVDQI